jgi:Protein RETICULATA-related
MHATLCLEIHLCTIVLILLQILGVGAAVVGDMSSRPNWGLNELDFVFSTLIVGSIMNFSLMYLLAATGAKATAAMPKNLLARLFDERTLTRMGAPGGHIFEKGFSFGGRAINLMYKTAMFGTIGFFAGLAGVLSFTVHRVHYLQISVHSLRRYWILLCARSAACHFWKTYTAAALNKQLE